MNYAEGEQAVQLLTENPQAVVARLQVAGTDRVAILFDAIADKLFLKSLLETIAQNCTCPGTSGKLVATATEQFHLFCRDRSCAEPSLLKGERSNTSIIYSDIAGDGASPQLILKLFRKIEEGINPDLEIRRF